MAIINVHEATIHSFNVTIKALQVGRKQVTMGLFRQLPLGELVALDTLQLHGVPWGHVRYFWDKDGRTMPEDEYLHAVWQRGEMLHRALVPKSPAPSQMVCWTEQQAHYELQALLVVLPKGPKIDLVSISRHVIAAAAACTVYVAQPGSSFQAQTDQATANLIHEYWHWSRYRSSGIRAGWEWHLEHAYDEVMAAQALVHRTVDDISRDLAPILSQKEAYLTGWNEIYLALASLPQLFIAV